MGGGGKIGKKSRYLTKNCTNLKELGPILESYKNIFPKILVWGGYNKLKCLEKN